MRSELPGPDQDVPERGASQCLLRHGLIIWGGYLPKFRDTAHSLQAAQRARECITKQVPGAENQSVNQSVYREKYVAQFREFIVGYHVNSLVRFPNSPEPLVLSAKQG